MTRSPVRTSAVVMLAAVVLCATGGALEAGPINPPAGPVAPTPGPEPRIAINAVNTPGDADSLFRITQPGSYYLSGNITGVVGKRGIVITSGGVTIDLNGFELRGVATPGFGYDGIRTAGVGETNITVLNGSVRGWSGNGLEIGANLMKGSIVRGVTASENGGDGIVVGNGSVVTECTASDNLGDGFRVSSGSTITACSAYNNGTDGIEGSNNCTITGCTAGTNNGDGIKAGFASKITACSSYVNEGVGIAGTDYGVSITDCSSRGNDDHNISVTHHSLVRGNLCSAINTQTTGAGIYVSNDNNRIEGNHCIDAVKGIQVDGVSNVIIGNTCADNNVNYDIAANNIYGAIVNRVGAVTAAVNGSGAAISTMGSSDPHANFSH
ncbi:MAG: right-handed parallel beta-helix repeat-containing protein [Phycisphaerales bacterium]